MIFEKTGTLQADTCAEIYSGRLLDKGALVKAVCLESSS